MGALLCRRSVKKRQRTEEELVLAHITELNSLELKLIQRNFCSTVLLNEYIGKCCDLIEFFNVCNKNKQEQYYLLKMKEAIDRTAKAKSEFPSSIKTVELSLIEYIHEKELNDKIIEKELDSQKNEMNRKISLRNMKKIRKSFKGTLNGKNITILSNVTNDSVFN